jgi:hypothetical protein
MSSFCVNIFAPKTCKDKLSVTREKLCKTLSYEKVAHKMLIKLTPGLYFINVLNTAITLIDPKSVKKTLMT